MNCPELLKISPEEELLLWERYESFQRQKEMAKRKFMENEPERAVYRVPERAFVAPRFGEFVLCCLCSPDKTEEVLGDLQEMCEWSAKKHGERAARKLYWWHVLRTIARYALRLLSGAALITAILKKLM